MNSHPEAGNIDQQIALFADAGFDSFFLSCGVTTEFDRIPHWAAIARGVSIAFEAVHAPTDGVNALWLTEDHPATHAYLSRAEHILDLCGEAGVSKLVLHTAYGAPPPISSIGLARFSRLEAYADTRGVSLCYENASVAEHLLAVVRNASTGHGFCHDTGHQLCYTPDMDYLSACQAKLLYTHLHDNHGTADEHLLPYDGQRDWDAYASALAEDGYTGTLNAELSCTWRADYRAMSYPSFLRLAIARVHRLAQAVEQHRLAANHFL